MNHFEEKIRSRGFNLTKRPIEVLQVNVGKFCNMACSHCHVEAGPKKTVENMTQETAEAVVQALDRLHIKTFDLTGGAPELNPHFRFLVREAHRRGIHIMDRCNLTVLFVPGQEDLAEFLASYKVEVVASLPCYLQENVDKQRGKGAFDESIKALLKLNKLGYGKVGADLRVRLWRARQVHPRNIETKGAHMGAPLQLNLVYNPVGPHLPPDQKKLEEEYRSRLGEDFGVRFNKLYCLANMPITRYAAYLKNHRQYDTYAELLETHFNFETVDGLMCRSTLSVGWDGRVYDCDFNQALGLALGNGTPLRLDDVGAGGLNANEIRTGDHCFGCTAGAGSSCRGALT